jgi:hypothetical protein
MTSAILSFLFLFAATTTTTTPQPVTKEAALNQEFEIRFGQQVSIKREGLKISFSSVAEDSRCPTGVQCIWAGNGKIVLKLSKVRKRAALLRLNTTVDPKQDDYLGYDVKLVSLSPYPKKDVGIRKRDYVATIIVTKK